MADEFIPKINRDQIMVYEIRTAGHLSPQWAEWFGGAAIALQENGDSLLTCSVIDQAALHGLLRIVRDLGLPLISVNRVEAGRAEMPDNQQLSLKGEYNE